MFEASQPGFYDIILMDVEMSFMNGMTAAQEIRKLEASISVTRLMITHDLSVAKHARRVVHIIDGELTEFTEFVPLGGSRYLLYTATDKAIVEYIEGEITALWHAHRISEPAQGLFPGDMRLMSLAEQDFFPGEGASFSGTDWITGDANAQYVITLQNGEMVYTGKISQDLVDQDGNRTGIVWQDIAPITLLA